MNLLKAASRYGMFPVIAFTQIIPLGKLYGQAADCSGNQAQNETIGTPPKNAFVAPNQNFHVNVNAITNAYTTNQAADIINGIREWAGGNNGLTLTFDSSSPGIGVITVSPGSGLGSVERARFVAGQYPPGGSTPPNQITSGTLQFDLNYQIANCNGTSSCLGYDSAVPNADPSLKATASHGMGHLMGLDDTVDAGCNQTSTSNMGGQCGTNNNGSGMSAPAPSSETPTACDKANVYTQSANGGSAGTSGGGGSASGGGDGGGSGGYGCTVYGYSYYDDSSDTLYYYYGCD